MHITVQNLSNINDQIQSKTMEFKLANYSPNIIAVSNSNRLKISNDGGLTFSEVSQFLPNQFITDIAFDPNNDNTIIVTYGSYGNNNQKVYINVSAAEILYSIRIKNMIQEVAGQAFMTL